MQAKGVGKRLLLVHGYCSGGVWPASQFSSASTFLDVNQNRSHDVFAQKIKAFGNTWNSYGVVAHSQGGAASLHLYTYYWSGLDNATGSRLIRVRSERPTRAPTWPESSPSSAAGSASGSATTPT